jgi:2-amino-4-hydroxy-6-hydroxymethyldihydropteridine diphosphokinase
MNRTYLLIGGNLGDRRENLGHAAKMIAAKVGTVLLASSLYETEAWGVTDQPPFLNQVLLVETKLDPKQVLEAILAIEREMGRKRMEKFGPRTIDIDILFFNDVVMHENSLTIPHPQLHLRRFTLAPLNEIAPQFVHPVFNKSISHLLEQLADPLVVKKF